MAVVLDFNATPEAELLQHLAALLRAGEVVVLPTEAGYLPVATLREGLPALRTLARSRSEGMLHLACGGREEVHAWLPAGQLPPVADRFLRRLWPGLLSVGVPLPGENPSPALEMVRQLQQTDAAGDAALYLACLDAPIYQDLLMQGVGPLALLDGPLFAAATEVPQEGVGAIVDAGPRAANAITRVRCAQANGWEIEQPGSVTREMLELAAGRWWLFVCTGNTCRSPMAEALFKQCLARRLGCSVAELPGRGYNVLSAGVSTHGGDGAAREAVETVEELGADLSRHRSRGLTEALVAGADHLVAMTRGHLMAVLSRSAPEGSMHLLCGGEGDLEDPIGSGSEVYRACGRTILRHVERLIAEYQLL